MSVSFGAKTRRTISIDDNTIAELSINFNISQNLKNSAYIIKVIEAHLPSHSDFTWATHIHLNFVIKPIHSNILYEVADQINATFSKYTCGARFIAAHAYPEKYCIKISFERIHLKEGNRGLAIIQKS